MSAGLHDHTWRYNEAERGMYGNILKWFVIRFCTVCYEVETIELKEITRELK